MLLGQNFIGRQRTARRRVRRLQSPRRQPGRPPLRSGLQAVTRRSLRKDATMRSKLLLIALSSAACRLAPRPARCSRPRRRLGQRPGRDPRRLCVRRGRAGRSARSGRSASGSTAGSAASASVTATRSTLTAPTLTAARGQVAQIAGRYGMLVSAGAPVTAGRGPPRHRFASSSAAAERSVPSCPNWTRPSQPEFREPSRCPTSAAR